MAVSAHENRPGNVKHVLRPHIDSWVGNLVTTIAGSHSAIEEGRDLSSMSGILADTAYRLLLA